MQVDRVGGIHGRGFRRTLDFIADRRTGTKARGCGAVGGGILLATGSWGVGSCAAFCQVMTSST